MIKYIFFDLDNTIYPERDYYKQCYNRIATVISPSEQDKIVGKMLFFRERFGDYEVFQKLAEYLAIGQEAIKTWIEMYRTCDVQIAPYEDVKCFFMSNSLEVKNGLLTNGGSITQRNKLRCLQMGSFFDYIYITGEHLNKEYWKPNIKAFELLKKNSQLNLEECLYIGDSFEKDIKGALNAGMHAALINRSSKYKKVFFKNKNYWIINTFADIKTVVNAINNKKA